MKPLQNLFFSLALIFSTVSILPAQWNISTSFAGGFLSSIITDGPVIYAGTSLGVFKSTDNGINWVQVNEGLGTSTNIQTLTKKGNYIFAGTSSTGVYASSNQGANWIQATQGIAQQNIKALTSDGNNVYAGCVFAGVFRSTNNGLNWSRYGLGEGDLLYSLAYNETSFFVGLYGGIYRTTNDGVNWMTAHTGLTNNDVRCIVTAGQKTYCATYGGGVCMSDNNGATWTPFSSGLTDQKVISLADIGDYLFAATYGRGVQLLNGSTGSWTPINQGLSDTSIASVAVNDNYVFAGSVRGNLWKRPLNEVITAIENNTVQYPDEFKLHQNFPNPFNPSTEISFYIPANSFLTLKVYDNLGKEISELYSGNLSRGNHSILFNAENYPAGIYYYTLTSGSFSETRKLMLVK